MTNVTFESFSAEVSEAGLTPVKFSENVFFVKPNTKGAGKVEFNIKSNQFVVGSGSKHLEAITAAVQTAGFKVTKRVKGWTLFEATNMADFIRVVGIVEQAVPFADKAPKVKAPKAKVTVNSLVSKALSVAAKPKSAAQIMRAAEIKAKNLATMKAVSAKINAEKAA